MTTFLKLIISGLPLLLWVLPASLNGQAYRYFQFKIECGHGNWQDTAVVAATTDPDLATAFLDELEKPFDERNFINGKIAHGDGGHNRNADHRFNWHFVPDEWVLAELAVEVCSGCPFTDLDRNPVYWVDTLGFFCPWSARPVREVTNPATGVRPPVSELDFRMYPNPTTGPVRITLPRGAPADCLITDVTGRPLHRERMSGIARTFNLPPLPPGAYLVRVTQGGRSGTRRLLVW